MTPRNNKQAEIEVGEENEKKILEKLKQYFNEHKRQYIFEKTEELHPFDYKVKDTKDTLIAYLEIKSRNIRSDKWNDIMCPKQKYDFAKGQEIKCYLLTMFKDGVFMLDMKNKDPFMIQDVDRIDKTGRMDVDNRRHCFWKIGQAVKLWKEGE
jgi:hypothetical protein